VKSCLSRPNGYSRNRERKFTLPKDAVNEIRSLIGRKFDPAVITAFNQCLGELLLLNQTLSEASTKNTSSEDKVTRLYK